MNFLNEHPVQVLYLLPLLLSCIVLTFDLIKRIVTNETLLVSDILKGILLIIIPLVNIVVPIIALIGLIHYIYDLEFISKILNYRILR